MSYQADYITFNTPHMQECVFTDIITETSLSLAKGENQCNKDGYHGDPNTGILLAGIVAEKSPKFLLGFWAEIWFMLEVWAAAAKTPVNTSSNVLFFFYNSSE